MIRRLTSELAGKIYGEPMRLSQTLYDELEKNISFLTGGIQNDFDRGIYWQLAKESFILMFDADAVRPLSVGEIAKAQADDTLVRLNLGDVEDPAKKIDPNTEFGKRNAEIYKRHLALNVPNARRLASNLFEGEDRLELDSEQIARIKEILMRRYKIAQINPKITFQDLRQTDPIVYLDISVDYPVVRLITRDRMSYSGDELL